MSIFGPSIKTVYTELADTMGGTYHTKGWFRRGYLSYFYRNWEIILDTYTVGDGDDGSQTYTRLRALFHNPYGFQFNVYRGHIFSRIGKLFGMQDIETGDPEFDKRYIVKGNDPGKVGALMADYRVKDMLQRTGRVTLKIDKHGGGFFGKSYPEGVSQLYFQKSGKIKNIPQLKLFIQLMSTVLDDMVELGITDNDKVNVQVQV